MLDLPGRACGRATATLIPVPAPPGCLLIMYRCTRAHRDCILLHGLATRPILQLDLIVCSWVMYS